MEKEFEATTPINRTHFGKSERRIQYLATISVCFAALGAGTVLAWSSPALSDLASPPADTTNTTILDLLSQNGTDQRIVLDKNQEALLGAILNLGALFYALPTGYIADKFGRKMAVYSSGLSFLLGWIFIVIANNFELLLLGRFLGGMGLGAACVATPMYIGEIAENAIRATLSSYFQIFVCLGILITFVVGSFTDYVVMSVILGIFPVILLVTFYFMPESHVYLLKIGNGKKAERNLVILRGNKYNYDIKGEMCVIQEEIDRSSNKTGNLGEILMKKANRRALVAVLGMLAFQQLNGINAITFYTEQIFAAAGNSVVDPSKAAIIMSVLQCCGGYLTMVFINKAGRKYFLILSSICMMIGLFGLGMFFHLQKLKIQTIDLSLLPIACAVTYIVAFTIGYGAIPYMMMHELFSPEIREMGSGAAVVIAWTSSFFITYAFPISVQVLGNYVTFYMLTGINAICIIFVLIFVPETRGKTLLEIQDLLGR